MKKPILTAALLTLAFAPCLKAEYLFEGYFYPNGQESPLFDWYGFNSYGPEEANFHGVNTPRYNNAPGGAPVAVIRQLSEGAQLAGTSNGYGRIYSHTAPLNFALTYDHGAPLDGMLLFQFQTSGAQVDLSSIALNYTVGGTVYSVAATDYIREFAKDGSPTALGFSLLNRFALSWDLSALNALGAESFEIVWKGSDIGMSFHDAMLDFYTGPSVVAEGRTWTAAGSNLSWSNGANWQQGTSSQEQGNVRFENTGAANVSLNEDRKIGELAFNSSHGVELDIESGSKLEIYTGIFTSTAATGVYKVAGEIELGAFGYFGIEAGTVIVDGSIAGDYGIVKRGDGTLYLNGDNTFGSGPEGGSLTMHGGVMEVSGTNSYTGITSVIMGQLRVAGDVESGVAGALGNSSSNIILGANSEQYGDEYTAPSLVIVGDHTISRQIELKGIVEKSIGAVDTVNGAVYSSTLNLSMTGSTPFDKVTLFAEKSTDRFILTGAVTGGLANATLTIGGAGTVVFDGPGAKDYVNNTRVASGTLLIANGVNVNNSRVFTVDSGATLVVNGTLGAGANRTLTLAGGAKLEGSGSVLRKFTIESGAILAAGNSVGKLTTTNQTWGNAGILEFEIGENDWDQIALIAAGSGSNATVGSLTIDLTGGDTFLIRIFGLDEALTGEAGLFDGTQDNYWTFLTAAGGIDGFDANRFTFDGSGLGAGFDGLFSIEQNGNDLLLVYTAAPIPEPSTYALIGAGAALYGFLRRRRKAA